VEKKELIRFASRSESENFLKDFFNIASWGFSHNLSHIFGKTDRIFVKVLSEMYV